jgi:hypothetical protein
VQQDENRFRKVCEHAGLAVAHQRQVIYEVLTTLLPFDARAGTWN